ncbi:MAG: alanine racemase, partial [Peptococcales bacterium]
LKFTFHLKVETGLGRTGLKYDQLAKFVEIMRNNNDTTFEGVYSHLATSMWSDNSFSKKQFSEFTKAIDFLKSHGFNPPLKHICNSAAFVKFPEMHLDMVRAGTILYGQEVAGQREFQGHLQKAWSLKGQITYINELPRDHSIGYERSYILKAPAKTAIVPIGFHHGFSVEPIPRPKGFIDLVKVIGKTLLRYFDHHRVRTYARVRDKDVPVLGKVGMQQTVLDVSTIPDIQVGDIVELPGRRTNISPELPKVYLKDGKPQQISRISEKYELVRGTSSYD